MIERLKAYLLAEDEPPSVTEISSPKPPRPHHRSGGTRPPLDPTLRLFAVISHRRPREATGDDDAGEAAA